MKTQEEIFNRVGVLAYDLKSLGRYVQNDLTYMIRNSDTNLHNLKENKAKFIEDVQEFTDSLYEVCKDIANVYDEAITNYDAIKGN